MGISSGHEEFQQILDTLGANPPRERRMIIDGPSIVDSDEEKNLVTPSGTQNPEPPGFGAPFLPNDLDGNFLLRIPGHNAITPTPTEVSPTHI